MDEQNLLQQLWGYAVPSDVLRKIRECQSLAEMEVLVGQVLSDIGFSMATYHLVRVDGQGDNLHSFFSSYPDEWLARYLERGYLKNDVVYHRARQSVVPFSWGECEHLLLANDKAGVLFNEARQFGVYDGFTVPIHGPNSFALFSVVADGGKAERNNSIEMARGALTLLGLNVHERAAELLAGTRTGHAIEQLTAREKECLRWVAAGKSTSMISTILNISNSTVDAHIQAAMRKLNAQSRTHAAVRAVALGIIPLE